MEKYGFVYIWYDRKYKRYYIGCHWGTENDGYVCSSTWMMQAYKRRPEDFRRKILSRIYSSRKDLFEEEHKWLSLINNNELKNKYYNVYNRKFDHFNENNLEQIKKTISERTKEAMANPEIRKRYEEALKKRDTRSSDPEVRAKRSKSMMGKNKVNTPKQLMSARQAAKDRIGIPLSKEHKIKIASAGVFKKLNASKKTCPHCGFTGNPGNIGRYHGDKCKKVKNS